MAGIYMFCWVLCVMQLIPANVVKEHKLKFCDHIKYIDGEGIMHGVKGKWTDDRIFFKGWDKICRRLKSMILSTVRCFTSGRKFTQSRSPSHVVESLIIIIIIIIFSSAPSPHPSSITHHHHYHEFYGFCLFYECCSFLLRFYRSSTFLIPKKPCDLIDVSCCIFNAYHAMHLCLLCDQKDQAIPSYCLG